MRKMFSSIRIRSSCQKMFFSRIEFCPVLNLPVTTRLGKRFGIATIARLPPWRMQVRFELSAPIHFGDIWNELEKTKKINLI
jgi:hypothetical protein